MLPGVVRPAGRVPLLPEGCSHCGDVLAGIRGSLLMDLRQRPEPRRGEGEHFEKSGKISVGSNVRRCKLKTSKSGARRCGTMMPGAKRACRCSSYLIILPRADFRA